MKPSSAFALRRLAQLRKRHEALLSLKNKVDPTWDNGVFER